jgi:hypothetical protein
MQVRNFGKLIKIFVEDTSVTENDVADGNSYINRLTLK